MDIASSQVIVQPSPRRFSLAQTLLFHLVPGIAIALAFVVLAWVMSPRGWPPSLALLLAWLIAGIPMLLAILFYQGRRRNGALSLEGVLLYQEPLSWRQYAWLIPALLVWAALASTLLFPLDESIRLSPVFTLPFLVAVGRCRPDNHVIIGGVRRAMEAQCLPEHPGSLFVEPARNYWPGGRHPGSRQLTKG